MFPGVSIKYLPVLHKKKQESRTSFYCKIYVLRICWPCIAYNLCMDATGKTRPERLSMQVSCHNHHGHNFHYNYGDYDKFFLVIVFCLEIFESKFSKF